MTRIFIVEDEALIAEDIRYNLEQLDYKVVGHAMNGDRALDKIAKTEADLFLLDINIKGTLSGIDLAKVIRDKYKKPYIFLTSFSDAKTLEEAMGTIPYGYIVKPFNENDLKVNIKLALSKYNSEQGKREFTKEYAEDRIGSKLSDREFSVLKAFRDGLTYKEAGEQLYISTNTIKTYQKRLFSLMEVSSKYEMLKKIE